MDKEEFNAKVRDGVNKALETSKKALGKAGKAVQDFSDKSVVRIEKHQLQTKLDGQYKKLGLLAAQRFFEDKTASVSGDEEEVIQILEEIKKLSEEISKRDGQLTKNTADIKN